ncbi:9980_t:CDS:2 [Cetraspora pellucida]|uniref:9980_t:CDS:1 n=1 Tax=Cetraspora pellucida TaxID=1433469 RepID=A0ACA9JYJ0_9GLOM|nr:9980_t:CDS:2 [Cetraspora pellucida]
MDEYKREKNQNHGGDKSEEPVTSSKTDVNIYILANELATLKINYIEQKDQEEHIIRNCPDRDKNSDQTDKNIKFKNVDIRMIEFMKINTELVDEYLKIKLLNNNEQYDVRPIGKRKRGNEVAESSEQSNKKEKISELDFVEELIYKIDLENKK